MKYVVYDVNTAPNAAKEELRNAEKSFGFVPNLLGVMAGAPALLEAYRAMAGFFEKTSLTPTERQIVLLTTSFENTCEYCVAAHSAIAGMQKVSSDVVDAIRNGRPIDDQKLEALRQFTSAVVTSRGWPSDSATKSFFDAGYAKVQVLEVVLGVGFKTLSNYTNHIADTPLDRAFARAAWTKAA